MPLLRGNASPLTDGATRVSRNINHTQSEARTAKMLSVSRFGSRCRRSATASAAAAAACQSMCALHRISHDLSPGCGPFKKEKERKCGLSCISHSLFQCRRVGMAENFCYSAELRNCNESNTPATASRRRRAANRAKKFSDWIEFWLRWTFGLIHTRSVDCENYSRYKHLICGSFARNDSMLWRHSVMEQLPHTVSS